MKKSVLFVAVAALALSFSSCKKDYTCDCTVNGNTTSTPLENVSKSDAEDACDALNTLNSIGGGSCTLN